MAARWRALADSGQAFSAQSVALSPSWLGHPCGLLAQLVLCLWSYIQLPLHPCVPRRNLMGLVYWGRAVRGRERCCVDSGAVLHQCPWAPAHLRCCVPLPGQPQQWKTTSSTPLCTHLQQDTWGQSRFCLISAMALEAIDYLGCHCFLKDGGSERHSTVHSAD